MGGARLREELEDLKVVGARVDALHEHREVAAHRLLKSGAAMVQVCFPSLAFASANSITCWATTCIAKLF